MVWLTAARGAQHQHIRLTLQQLACLSIEQTHVVSTWCSLHPHVSDSCVASRSVASCVFASVVGVLMRKCSIPMRNRSAFRCHSHVGSPFTE
jgi:hypothetical protein